jgi:sarcosine oxidase
VTCAESGLSHRTERDGTDDDDPVALALRSFVTRYFPDAAGPTMSMKVCMFTNTPDEHFILDRHPDCPQVAIVSPCSGHGFKFSSVIGEIVADLAEEGRTRHHVGMFRLARFGAIAGAAAGQA